MSLEGAQAAIDDFTKMYNIHAMIMMGVQKSSSVFVFKSFRNQQTLFDLLKTTLITAMPESQERTLVEPIRYAEFFSVQEDKDYVDRDALIILFKQQLHGAHSLYGLN